MIDLYSRTGLDLRNVDLFAGNLVMIETDGDLALGNVITTEPQGTVVLTAPAGSVSHPGSLIRTVLLNVRAAKGVDLVTEVGQADVVVSGSGSIRLLETDGLVLNNLVAMDGAAIVRAGGTITGLHVVSSSDVTLIAENGGDLLIDYVGANESSGSVHLTADGDIRECWGDPDDGDCYDVVDLVAHSAWLRAATGTIANAQPEVLEMNVAQLYSGTSNTLPVAQAGGPYTAPEGASVELDASGSTDPEQPGTTLTYAWDLDGDGVFGETGAGALCGDEIGMYPVFSAAGLDGPSEVAVALWVTDQTYYRFLAGDPADIDLAQEDFTDASRWSPDVESFQVAEGVVDLVQGDIVRDGSTYYRFLQADETGVDLESEVLSDTSRWSTSIEDYDVSAGNGDLLGVVSLALGDIVKTDGETATDATIINITNVTPTPGIDGPADGFEGLLISLVASATDPAGANDVVSLAWTVTKNGTAFASGTGSAIEFTPDDNATYEVILTASDEDGDSAQTAHVVSVANVAPVVQAGADQEANEGQEVSFTGLFSDAGLADTHTVAWSFGDGGTAAGVLTSNHTYADNGTYTVTVTVTDDEGAGSSDTLTVTVANVAPVVTAGEPQTAAEGTAVVLAASFTDAGSGDTHTAVVDWGDGTAATNIDSAASPLAVSHTYVDNGAYAVTVTVADDEGASATGTLLVTVLNVAPTVDAGLDQTADEGTAVSFTGSFSDAGLVDTHTVMWSFGDGGTASGTLTPTHTYADNGSYTVTVAVTDDDGGSTVDSLIVTVSNVAPMVEAGADQIVAEGQFLTLDPARFRDPGYGPTETFTVKIEWGDGTAEPAADITLLETPGGEGVPTQGTIQAGHAYADDGEYTVTVMVTDDEGAGASDTFTVTVHDVAPAVEAGKDQRVTKGSFLTLDSAQFSDPGFDDEVEAVIWREDFTATIDWGDGTTESAAGITLVETPGSEGVATTGTIQAGHVYVDNGVYTVTVTVTDDDGGAGTDRFTVRVGNVLPTDIAVTVELRDSTGALIQDSGAGIRYQLNGSGSYLPLGETEELGASGSKTMMLAKGKHRFSLTYQGCTQTIRQDISTNPTVVFQTHLVTVELRDSLGALIEGSGATVRWRPYGSSTLAAFGSGRLDAAGRVQMEVLPLGHKYGLTYQGATQYQLSSAATVVFQTHLVTVELRDSLGALIEGSGATVRWRPYGSSTLAAFGSGRLDAAGRVQMEVLPLGHKYGLTYQGATQYQLSSAATVVFQTHLVTVELRDSLGALIEGSGATVRWRPYGSSTLAAFGSGRLDAAGRVQMEVLPLGHKYGLTYQGATQYQLSSAATVVFQTHLVTVELRDSLGALIEGSGATVRWRPYGSSTLAAFGSGRLDAAGRVQMEVLPLGHKYGLTYQGATQYQLSSAATVVFQTHLVTVELRDSLGALIEGSGATVRWRPYGSSTLAAFGSGRLDAAGRVQMEVLPLGHKYGLTYQGATQYQLSSAATVVFQTHLVTVELREKGMT